MTDETTLEARAEYLAERVKDRIRSIKNCGNGVPCGICDGMAYGIYKDLDALAEAARVEGARHYERTVLDEWIPRRVILRLAADGDDLAETLSKLVDALDAYDGQEVAEDFMGMTESEWIEETGGSISDPTRGRGLKRRERAQTEGRTR